MDIDQLIKKYGNQSAVARRFGEELQESEQSRSMQRLIRKIKAGLRPQPDQA